MQKIKVSMKNIKEDNHLIIGIPYCLAQYLLRYEKAIAFSASDVYGWSCDYYDVDGVAISTGYRYIEKNTKVDYNSLRRYEEAAKEKATANDIKKLLSEFVKECVNNG